MTMKMRMKMRFILRWAHSLLLSVLIYLPLSAQDETTDKNSGVRLVFKDKPSLRFGRILRIDFRAKVQGDFRAFSPDRNTRFRFVAGAFSGGAKGLNCFIRRDFHGWTAGAL